MTDLHEGSIVKLNKIYDKIMGTHPFKDGINLKNLEALLTEFYAVSVMFPYIQAASHEKLIEELLLNGDEISLAVESTAVVSAFLYWDEMGGYHKINKYGPKGLPKILETSGFHSNLLRNDFEKIFKKKMKFACSSLTQNYLSKLKAELSSPIDSERIAAMVAFEFNAGNMIQYLYDNILEYHPQLNKSLHYFESHVGGADPAEAYHVQMTIKLIENIKGESQFDQFLKYFENSCALHKKWCEGIKNIDRTLRIQNAEINYIQ